MGLIGASPRTRGLLGGRAQPVATGALLLAVPVRASLDDARRPRTGLRYGRGAPACSAGRSHPSDAGALPRRTRDHAQHERRRAALATRAITAWLSANDDDVAAVRADISKHQAEALR